MRIEHKMMQDLYEVAKGAEPSQIKHLNQTERKTLRVMLRGLKKGTAFVDVKGVKELTLEDLKAKLGLTISKKPSSLARRIMKFFRNILGLRISSKKIMKEIRYVTNVMTQKKEELKEANEQIVPLRSKIEELTKSDTLTREQKAELEKHRKEMEALTAKKDRLKKFLRPAEKASAEAIKQRAVAKKKEVDSIKKTFISGCIKRTRKNNFNDIESMDYGRITNSTEILFGRANDSFFLHGSYGVGGSGSK